MFLNSIVLAIGLTLATCLVFVCSPVIGSGSGMSNKKLNLISDISAKELKNNFKVFLTKMKVRRVPLAKKRSELSLARLYKDERELSEEVSNLEEDLDNIDRRQTLGQAEILSKLPKEETINLKGAQAKVKELATNKIKDLEQSLEIKKAQLDQVRRDVKLAKEIIKDPEGYISVPKEFAPDPEKYREIEQELLIRDRENILWREQIQNNIIQPTWITDGW